MTLVRGLLVLNMVPLVISMLVFVLKILRVPRDETLLLILTTALAFSLLVNVCSRVTPLSDVGTNVRLLKLGLMSTTSIRLTRGRTLCNILIEAVGPTDIFIPVFVPWTTLTYFPGPQAVLQRNAIMLVFVLVKCVMQCLGLMTTRRMLRYPVAVP